MAPAFGEDQSFISGCHRQAKMVCWQCYKYSCPTLCDPLDGSPSDSSVTGFSSKNTGMDCHALFQEIFLTQGLNQSVLCLLLCRWVLYHSSPGGSEVKASACNEGDLGSIPGLGRCPGEGNGDLSYSCLENLMDGGAWWATAHGVAKSWTRLSDLT